MRFVQGIDYGARKGTLGLGFHLAEGGDGTLGYLARHLNETAAAWAQRVRGVSCHALILSTGEVVQMVDFGHAAGSFNPADRNPATSGYYNGTVIRDVLGAGYADANAWSIVTEITGFRAAGPNPLQVAAAIAWGKAMRAKYPSLRGAFGHADQTDTKGCPGTTPAMKAIFAGVGGHGLWTPQEVDVIPARITDESPKLVTKAAGTPWFDLDGTTVLYKTPGALTSRPSPYGVGTLRAIYANVPDAAHRRIVLIQPASVAPVPVPDCAPAVTAERDRVKKAAVVAVGAIK